MKLRAAVLAALLLAAVDRDAAAFGPGGHVEAAEATYDQVATLPGNAALQNNAVARRCYAWGSVFPDVRNVTWFRPQLEALKRRIEDVPGVRRMRLDLTDIEPPGFDTHDLRLGLYVVESARTTGSAELLAFALGCLSHGCQDRDEQTFTMHRLALAGRAGDVGIGPAAGSNQPWSPAGEIQTACEIMRDAGQPTSRLMWVRDATRSLEVGGLRAHARSLALSLRLTTFYYTAARDYALGLDPTAKTITARGFVNAVGALEAALVAIPAIYGRERMGEAARTIKSRYVDLRWWADVIYAITDVLARVFTLGRRGVLDLTDLVVGSCKGRALAGAPLIDVLEGAVHGGASWQRVQARYAGNAEFLRLQASGILSPATHRSVDVARAITLDVSARGAVSRWVDWPLMDVRSFRGAAAASFLVPPGAQGFEARAAGFVVGDVRWLDAATGQAITLLGANDAGRRVRVEVTLVGLSPQASALFGSQWLPFDVAIREDAIQGADPVLAITSATVPPEHVDPVRMGDLAPPVMTLDATVPLTAGTRGYHLELRYEGRLVFTTDWDVVAARGATAPHYASAYGTYHTDALRSLPIDGR